MAATHPHVAARGYGSNATYIFEYSRGLGGVDVPRDVIITRIIYVSLSAVAVALFCGRVAQISHAYLRQITASSADKRQQTFWAQEQSRWWSKIKKHILYAPLGKKRHNRELQLSSAVNVGTLPSRLQTILVALYFTSQVAYCFVLDYRVNKKAALLAELRGRSGVMAVLNMVPLFLLAGRNNPLIAILHVSFDTYNLLHRWLGRMVVLEAVIHTAAWTVNAVDEENFSLMLVRVRDTPFFLWGLIGTVAAVFLSLHSPSPIRHAFYETFLHLHQLAAVLTFVGVYLHLQLDNLPQQSWARSIACMWLGDRLARLFRLIHLNVSTSGTTTMVVQALPGEACRVTFHLPKLVQIEPGCHVFAYVPSISWWMSHPFSIAWTEPSTSSTAASIPSPAQRQTRGKESADVEKQSDLLNRLSKPSTQVSLIISARKGMTRRLYNAADASPSKTLTLSGFIEGPYGSHPTNPSSYGTTVLFSAGAGITHHLLYTRALVTAAAQNTAATRKVYLIWSVRSTDHLTWVSGYMDQILRLPDRRDILVVKLFISKPRRATDVVSPSATVLMHSGRCRPDVVLDEILPGRTGAMLVSVCGPGAFADEVRAAARERIGKGAVVDFVEEAFTW
ncbi:Metalloreductase, putative [Penicillium digitatum]|uniref:Metalloreductase, putative n=3 Tax=Penicillium digitatum TaxID=36651 RepID=K9G620_PEND2|nr:Metalloreductase, putative [Penicillium digitatum Pd1]EKV08960.1 Metalloreductase, putative [Penicillium digitatum Pd1]EKV10288.1 Metalloreductase, putative [Penicillium digitatum PHI26]QQK41911.1 Metalloreductase, putative [Penicillium digitatum]